MLPRAILTRSLARSLATTPHPLFPLRCLSTKPEHQEQAPKSWLTRKVESSPVAKKWFLTLTSFLGYGSPKQLAGRRSFVLYENIVATAPDQDPAFWQKGIYPTSYRFFVITNLPLSRMPPSANIPVLVHSNQSPYLAPHSPSARPSQRARTTLHSSTHRPLLHRRRRPHPRRSPTPIKALSSIHLHLVLLRQP